MQQTAESLRTQQFIDASNCTRLSFHLDEKFNVACSCDQRQIEFPQRQLEIPTQGIDKKEL